MIYKTHFSKPAAALVDEAPAPKNFFSNDGSFFENFKKITDAAKKAQQSVEKQPEEVKCAEESVPDDGLK